MKIITPEKSWGGAEYVILPAIEMSMHKPVGLADGWQAALEAAASMVTTFGVDSVVLGRHTDDDGKLIGYRRAAKITVDDWED